MGHFELLRAILSRSDLAKVDIEFAPTHLPFFGILCEAPVPVETSAVIEYEMERPIAKFEHSRFIQIGHAGPKCLFNILDNGSFELSPFRVDATSLFEEVRYRLLVIENDNTHPYHVEANDRRTCSSFYQKQSSWSI